jgi:hypothetical protein
MEPHASFMYERLGTPNELSAGQPLRSRSQPRSSRYAGLWRALAHAFRSGFRA